MYMCVCCTNEWMSDTQHTHRHTRCICIVYLRYNMGRVYSACRLGWIVWLCCAPSACVCECLVYAVPMPTERHSLPHSNIASYYNTDIIHPHYSIHNTRIRDSVHRLVGVCTSERRLPQTGIIHNRLFYDMMILILLVCDWVLCS